GLRDTSAGGPGPRLQHRGRLALPRPGGFASGLSPGHIYKSMADGRFAILDPAAGISGDMLLGALLSAGPPAAWPGGLPARRRASGVSVRVEAVDRCGGPAMKGDVPLPAVREVRR